MSLSGLLNKHLKPPPPRAEIMDIYQFRAIARSRARRASGEKHPTKAERRELARLIRARVPKN